MIKAPLPEEKTEKTILISRVAQLSFYHGTHQSCEPCLGLTHGLTDPRLTPPVHPPKGWGTLQRLDDECSFQ